MRPFTFDRTWHFAAEPDLVWRAVSRTDDFPRWWSWLDRFEADGLYPGAIARFQVRGPLPYVLRFRVDVDDVVPGERVVTRVSGDVAGPARLELGPDPAGGGTSARLVWALDVRRPFLRQVAVVGRPLMEWGHDRVVDLGLRQFESRALG